MNDQWEESAYFWEKHRAVIEQIFAPLTEAIINEAGILAGHRVLDIASGTGEPSIGIAQTVGPLISIISTDVVQQMVLAARNESRIRNLNNISFCVCAGQRLPFPDNSFDRLVCRLGVMFLGDSIVEALQGMLRVTKPGGKIVLTVWHESRFNPFFDVVIECVSRYVPSSPDSTEPSDAFRFAKKGLLAQYLKDAGATRVKERIFPFVITFPTLPFPDFWKFRVEISDSLREKLRDLSTNLKTTLAKDLDLAMRSYFKNDRLTFPAQAILVSVEKAIE